MTQQVKEKFNNNKRPKPEMGFLSFSLTHKSKYSFFRPITSIENFLTLSSTILHFTILLQVCKNPSSKQKLSKLLSEALS